MDVRKRALSAFVAAAVAVSLVPSPALADSYSAGSIASESQVVASAQSATADQNASLASQAASKKVKKAKFATRTKKVEKKAVEVKKGKTKLTLKGESGYIKFTAKKTKKYSFKFSGLKDNNDSSNAYIMLQTPDATSPKYCWLTNMSTKGGKSDTLWLSMNGADFTKWGYKLKDTPLASRTGKVKLKKGQIAYFYISAERNATMNLKIK